MPANNLDDQLTKYLTDAHSIERQAMAQMRAAPRIAGDQSIARVFSDHQAETEDHQRWVHERLQQRGAVPSKIKDLAGMVTGAGFALFAAAQPDTPGKLLVHAFSYEHMEEAAYDIVARLAAQAGDDATVEAADRIKLQESAMGDRVAGLFDRAADLALDGVAPAELDKKLDGYLADAHAIETQSLKLLNKGPKLAGTPDLASAYDEHRIETEEHRALIAARLRARGASPSRLKDAALHLGALNWGAFFGAQPDTPVKLAAFAYAVEHLEIGSHEMLKRAAQRAGDQETIAAVERILPEEQAAADRVHSSFGLALDAALQEQGVAVS